MLNIFAGKEDLIAEKKFFFGKLDCDLDFDWNNYIDLMDSHPENLYDRNTTKFRIGLNSFHSRPSAPKFAKEIVTQMEEFFPLHKEKITNIAFSGFGRNSDSYPWHCDKMDVFLVQVLNKIEFRLEGFNNDEAIWFCPGDFVWIPRGTHHQIIPHDSRVTFSFGVEGDPDPSTYF